MARKRSSAPSATHLDEIADRLLSLYADCDEDRPDSVLGCYPNSQKIIEALRTLIDVLFPGKLSHRSVHRAGLPAYIRRNTARALNLLRPELERALPFRWKGEAARHEGDHSPCAVKTEAKRILDRFAERLPDVRSLLIEDVRAAYEGDPAALTYAEVQLAYPGVLAITSHRIAHELYKLDVPIVPRIMSEWTHAQTGVDIHPGAQIGHGFFIDHATGVVSGESATILGGNTVIGRGSTIGGNVFLVESVPPNTMVSANHPDLRIKRSGDAGGNDWVI